ncbi:SusC/RagA family TonB-linked outer membrane protein [Sphingobacterium sp. UGAL515B_05]|uniref:SusC/RagA family TonB-linked outer membrane protein n=1 Tax=Sphingobacterium sp. UGAL515B_05 TaxID=2986767 RepID=UPI002954925C|nr:SusC/RagA family TonB-linked outer membrane protein [Sphingobacterium sp. UGAL515B_05]WON95601.1 SusC/RagA family TonB-linked outer membrane protein [Sphingobacterium sp. UGAL515B_05]
MSVFYKKSAGLALCTLFSATSLYAQQTVSGKVSDKTGPLAGATVAVKGSIVKTLTNEHGSFKIDAEKGQTIRISMIGYKTQEIVVGSSTTLKIELESDESSLDEVVVTALGIKRDKKSLGYATATISSDDLLKAGATENPFLAMYGKAAGVGINIGSAGPTGGVNIRIRGAAGLESGTNTRPLFVVDGVPLYDESTSMESRGYDPLNSFDMGSGINDLNAEDIESIEILKGAKATVLYGSQALNGVVLVTTKSGRKTRGLGIQVNQQISIDKPFTYIDFQNDYGSGASTNDLQYATVNGKEVRKLPLSRFSFGPKFDNSDIMLYDSTMGKYTAYPNNFIDFFQTAVNNRTNIAVAGGGEIGSARASYTTNTYNDILPGFKQKQNTFSFNGNFMPSKFASFEFVNNLYSINTTNRRPNIQQWVATGLNRDYDYNWIKGFYHDADGFRKDLEPYGLSGSSPGYWPNATSNILWEQNDNKDEDKKFHLVSSIKTTLRFSPHVSFIGQASIDYTNTDFITEDKIIRLTPNRIGGGYKWTKRNTTVQNYQGLMKYENTFNKDWNLFGFVGGAYQKITDNNMYTSTGNMGLLYPDWFSLNNANIANWPSAGSRGQVMNNGRGSDVLYSVLGSATLSYKESHYLEIQARNDWNSTLRSPKNSYFYPGLSYTWNFSNDFKIPKLQYGKLRLAWANVGGGPFTATGNRYFADNSFRVSQIPYSYGPISVTPPESLFLEEIKPFRKREIELGFNTRWFQNNRLEIDYAFYNNNTYNQIIQQTISPTTGYPMASINTGDLRNWGHELFIKAAPIANEKFRWDLTLTAANQFSKIVALYPGLKQKYITGNSGFQVWGKEGERIGEIRAYDYKRDESGNKIVGPNGLYQLSDAVSYIGKNVNPDIFGGFMNDFFFKGFNFHLGLDYKFGGSVFSYTNNYLMGTGVIKQSLPGRDEEHGGVAYYIDKNNKFIQTQHNAAAPSDSKDGIIYHDGIILDGVMEANGSYVKNSQIVSAPTYYGTYINDLGTSWPPDRLYKNDYIKFREISVSYTIPQRWANNLKLQKLTLTAAARNLGYLYKSIPNIDAEAALGAQSYIENSFYPSIRTFTFGVNVSF